MESIKIDKEKGELVLDGKIYNITLAKDKQCYPIRNIKLQIEVDSTGAIKNKEILETLAKILSYNLSFMRLDLFAISPSIFQAIDGNIKNSELSNILKTKLIDMDLSVRARGCLKEAQIETVLDLVNADTNWLLKHRNFGKNTLKELDQFLVSKGLYFGMDIIKYL